MRSSLYALSVCAGLSVLILSAGASEAGGKTVNVCNQAGRRLSVSIGWFDYGVPSARGWFSLANDQCQRLVIAEADGYLPLFAYAWDGSKDLKPRTDLTNYFCVDRANIFEQKSSAYCKFADESAKEIVSDWALFGALGNPIATYYQWTITD